MASKSWLGADCAGEDWMPRRCIYHTLDCHCQALDSWGSVARDESVHAMQLHCCLYCVCAYLSGAAAERHWHTALGCTDAQVLSTQAHRILRDSTLNLAIGHLAGSRAEQMLGRALWIGAGARSV